jgi:aromatic amino acid aminotransferase I
MSVETKGRIPSSLKAASSLLGTPGLISLGGGLPCAENFPFEEISLKVPKPPNFSEQETKESGQTLTIGKYDVKEGKSIFDLSIALVCVCLEILARYRKADNMSELRLGLWFCTTAQVT